MKTVFSAVIVDDDEVDGLTTLSFVRQQPFLQVAGLYENAEEALAAVATNKPDVLFLDVDMPGMSGLQLRAALLDVPACIFISAFADYALESFEVDALDFLVKPVNRERFEKAMLRLHDYLLLKNKAAILDNTLGGDSFFIKDGYEQVKINLHDVVYLEALKDYTSIVTAAKKYCVHSAMGNLIKEKNFSQFVRIHRSYAVQKNYIKKISSSEIQVNNVHLPVGRKYKDALADL